MQNTTQTTGKKTPSTHSLSSYRALLLAFPPRPISSEEELDATQRVINSLIDRDELTPDERAYLHILGLLVYEYEEIHYPMPDIYGVALIKALLVELNLQEKDLVPIFGTEAIVSEVLSGDRELTVSNLEKMAEFFHIDPSAFLKRVK